MTASAQDKGLQIQNLTVSNGGRALFDITARVAPGEIVSVMGPSGSGKSTLVAAIAGFLPKQFKCSGQISLNGTSVLGLAAQQRGFGVLFQDPLLFPHFSVAQNILFALDPYIRGERRKNYVAQALQDAELDGFETRDPATLSGGQKARVALLRTLAASPRALLLDEPFSKLDENLRQNVRQNVFDQIKKRGLPTLLVTHDLADAKHAGGQILQI